MKSHNIRLLFHTPLLLALAVHFLQAHPAAAAVVTAPPTALCITSDYDYICADKLRLTMQVSNGDSATVATEYIKTEIKSVNGKLTTITTLEPPIRFQVGKSLPLWSYPLRYLHSVDYAPFEELVKVTNSRPGSAACVDGAASIAPTCGCQIDGFGTTIPDSQGFCSNRDLLQLKTVTDPTNLWRGEKELGQSTQANSFSIAHCLRMNGVSYRGYEIDPPRREYTVSFSADQGGIPLTEFTLTPDIPGYITPSSVHQIKATLLGEEPIPRPVDLSGYILYVPTLLVGVPAAPEWSKALLVPRQMVSRDGSQCDKVGTGYGAFRLQSAVAGTSVTGACLGNQLKQLYEADLAKLAANPGADTDYLVSGKKLFKDNLPSMTGLALKIATPGSIYSRLHLVLDNARFSILETP